MSSFNGYLIIFPKANKNFPHRLIEKGSYESTPLQRTEIKSYRDSNNLLHRTISPNYKSKVTFTTIPLDLAELKEIITIINSAFISRQQRKLKVTYWDEELLSYRTMTAYMPDITYQINKITSNDIKYQGVTFTFIEY